MRREAPGRGGIKPGGGRGSFYKEKKIWAVRRSRYRIQEEEQSFSGVDGRTDGRMDGRKGMRNAGLFSHVYTT